MRKSIRHLFIFLLLASLVPAAFAQKVIGEAAKELAEQIAASAAKQQKHKIAVIPFRELDGRTTVLGTFLAEELVTDLFAAGNLDIVERSMLDKVMSELKLSQSGAIDPESAKHVGKIVGVEALVTGSITDLQSYVGVNCRLIDTETGRIFGAAQTKIVKDADLQKIMSASVPDTAAAPAPAATPAPKRDNPPQKTYGGIGFQVLECRATGGSVVCSFILTNQTQADRSFNLVIRDSDPATMIDDQSNEHRATGGSLGSRSADSVAWLPTTLVPGIPLKASLRFSEVPDSISGIRLLRIKFYVVENYSNNPFNADFRDLPLTR